MVSRPNLGGDSFFFTIVHPRPRRSSHGHERLRPYLIDKIIKVSKKKKVKLQQKYLYIKNKNKK